MKRFCMICLAVALATASFGFVHPSASLAYGETQSPSVATTVEEQDPAPSAVQDSPFRRASAPEIRSYDKVITKDAKSESLPVKKNEQR